MKTPAEILNQMGAPDTITPPSEATIRVELAMNNICELVTHHGPKHLVRGMPSYLAHEAMYECMKHLEGAFFAYRDLTLALLPNVDYEKLSPQTLKLIQERKAAVDAHFKKETL